MPNKKFRLDIRTKLMFALLILSVIPVIVLSYVAYLSSSNFFKENIRHSLNAIADLKAEAIGQFIGDRVQEVEALARMPHMVSDMTVITAYFAPKEEDVPAEPETPAEASEEGTAQEGSEMVAKDVSGEVLEKSEGRKIEASNEYQTLKDSLVFVQSRGKKYEELFVMDASGTVRASTHYEHEGKSASHNEYFKQGMNATFIQDTYVSGLTGRHSMVIASPVRDEIGKVIAILGARLNLETLHRVIKVEKGLGITGETVVGQKIEEEIVFMAPTRHDDNAALTRKIAIGTDMGFSIQEAAREREGSGFSLDYRGVRTLAAWRYIPSLQWGLVTKVDASEALEPIRRMRYQIAFIAILIALLAVFFAAVLSKGIVRPLQDLTVAAEKVSRGDLDVGLMVKSNDEVGDLSNSFERMVAAIKFLKEETKEDK